MNNIVCKIIRCKNKLLQFFSYGWMASIRHYIWFLMMLPLTCLISCTLDHGGREGQVIKSNHANIISGVVLAGGPVSGYVTLKNASTANISTSSVIDSAGRYSISLSNDMTGPYILEAKGTIGGRVVCLHSIGTRADISASLNITPLTELIVGNAVGQNPEDFFQHFSSLDLNKAATSENLSLHEALVRSRFSSLISMAGLDVDKVSLLNSQLNPDHSGLDGVIDLVRITPVWEGGARQPKVTISSIIAGTESVTDDFSVSTDNSPVPVPVRAVEALQAVVNIEFVFKRWANLFAADIPLVDNPDLLDLFSSEFKTNGLNKKDFLSKICLDNKLIKMSIYGLVVDDMDLDSGTAHVSFSVMRSDKKKESYYRWKMMLDNGTWKIMGNQQIVDLFVGPYAAFNQTDVALLKNGKGMCIYAVGPKSSELDSVHHIIVTGPGIQNSPLYTLSRFDEDSDVLFINSDSNPQGFYPDVSDLVLKDNSEYVFIMYGNDGLPMNPDGYVRILKCGNYTSDYLQSQHLQVFSVLKKPSQISLSFFEGGNVECQWDYPSRSVFKELDFHYRYNNQDNFFQEILPESLYITKQYTQSFAFSGLKLTHFDLNLRIVDEYDRVFDTFMIYETDGLPTMAHSIIDKDRVL